MFFRLAPAFAGFAVDLTLRVKLERVIRNKARDLAPRLPTCPQIDHLYQPDPAEELDNLRSRLRSHMPPI